jgi:hypothetical protein
MRNSSKAPSTRNPSRPRPCGIRLRHGSTMWNNMGTIICARHRPLDYWTGPLGIFLRAVHMECSQDIDRHCGVLQRHRPLGDRPGHSLRRSIRGIDRHVEHPVHIIDHSESVQASFTCNLSRRICPDLAQPSPKPLEDASTVLGCPK